MKDISSYNHVSELPEVPNFALARNWDKILLIDIPSRILSLLPREWVKESLSLHSEKLKSTGLNTTTIDRKILQMN